MRLLGLVFLVFLVSACDDDNESQDVFLAELAEARVTWGLNGISSYSLSITRSCFCPELSVKVFVDDSIESYSISDSGGLVEKVDYLEFSVERWFDEIEHVHQSEGSSVTVQYDQHYRYPNKITFDMDVLTNDDELHYTIELSTNHEIKQELLLHRSIWSDQQLHGYTYVYEFADENTDRERKYRVTVENKVVSNVVDIETGETVSDLAKVKTIDEWFDEVLALSDNPRKDIIVTFNEIGYPDFISVISEFNDGSLGAEQYHIWISELAGNDW